MNLDFDSKLVALAQRLIVDEPCPVASERFLRRFAECLRARHPGLREHELARCMLVARRACVREALDGD